MESHCFNLILKRQQLSRCPQGKESHMLLAAAAGFRLIKIFFFFFETEAGRLFNIPCYWLSIFPSSIILPLTAKTKILVIHCLWWLRTVLCSQEGARWRVRGSQGGCTLLPSLISAWSELNTSVRQGHRNQHGQNGFTAPGSIRIPKFIVLRECAKH